MIERRNLEQRKLIQADAPGAERGWATRLTQSSFTALVGKTAGVRKCERDVGWPVPVKQEEVKPNKTVLTDPGKWNRLIQATKPARAGSARLAKKFEAERARAS